MPKFSTIFIAILLTIGGILSAPIPSMESEALHLLSDVHVRTPVANPQPSGNKADLAYRRSSPKADVAYRRSSTSSLLERAAALVSRSLSLLPKKIPVSNELNLDLDPALNFNPIMCFGIADCNPVNVGGAQTIGNNLSI